MRPRPWLEQELRESQARLGWQVLKRTCPVCVAASPPLPRAGSLAGLPLRRSCGAAARAGAGRGPAHVPGPARPVSRPGP